MDSMTAPFIIWVDLDETLVRTCEEPYAGWTRLRINRWATLRPGAAECVQALRRLGPVAMLTFARLEYALAVCDAFPQLGFSTCEILAQEQWTSAFAEDPRFNRPDDILIEDQGSISLARKCRFIGLDVSRVVLVRPYRGEPDDVLASVPQQVKLLLKPTQITP